MTAKVPAITKRAYVEVWAGLPDVIERLTFLEAQAISPVICLSKVQTWGGVSDSFQQGTCFTFVNSLGKAAVQRNLYAQPSDYRVVRGVRGRRSTCTCPTTHTQAARQRSRLYLEAQGSNALEFNAQWPGRPATPQNKRTLAPFKITPCTSLAPKVPPTHAAKPDHRKGLR